MGGEYDYLLSQKLFYPDSIAAMVYSVWVRLIYQNLDTIAHKGWMMDSLNIVIEHNCEFISVEEINLSNPQFYPNPLLYESVLEYPNAKKEEFIFTVFDMFGRNIYEHVTKNNTIRLTREHFQKGCYLYRLTNQNYTIYTGKFIVE